LRVGPFVVQRISTSIRGDNNRNWTRVPVPRMPIPAIRIAMMPVAMMPVSVVVPIGVMIVAPVRLSVLVERQ
jgi:hypothetical protein